MNSLVNTARPPAFCPGCLHHSVVTALDKALQELGRAGHEVAIVTDIGCSGLFDTFFNTHAFHGLHGRALTYATGLKLARPELTVITIMGDGGLGIGGAHVLSSCRRNLDINLLVLNNFNYGMTGGQCSATTPADADTTSGFLGQLELPLDIGLVARAAGASWVERLLATDKSLAARLAKAITFRGFSLLDIRGICPGRFSKRNKKTIAELGEEMAALPALALPPTDQPRPEYGAAYRAHAAVLDPAPAPLSVIPKFSTALEDRCSVLILGAAGQRITTAGEILCLAGMAAGLHVSLKNDYPITVLRGHSVSEVILSRKPIGYTGIQTPTIIIALAREGVQRRAKDFRQCAEAALILAREDLELPETEGRILTVDVEQRSLPEKQWALAFLAELCRADSPLSEEMLRAGISSRFSGSVLADALHFIDRCLKDESS